MKSLKTLSVALIAALALVSFEGAAKTISAYGATLDSAEAHIAAKAKACGAKSYKITSARMDSDVYMTATINK